MVSVWSDGEIDYLHPRMCRCAFCKLERSRQEAVKMKVGWITRFKSKKWISEFPKMYNHNGNWRPFPKKRKKR